jgi:hypothetical protein
MAAKWADYVITRVRFNSAGTHIESVETYEHSGNSLTNQSSKTRSSVVSAIDSGKSFCTATKNSEGSYSYGAAVKVVSIDGEKWIKTKADRIKKDNLDNLPTF